jgi:hypothetical protein
MEAKGVSDGNKPIIAGFSGRHKLEGYGGGSWI